MPFHCMYTAHFVYPFISGWTRGSICLLAVVTGAAVRIPVQVSMCACVFISLGYGKVAFKGKRAPSLKSEPASWGSWSQEGHVTSLCLDFLKGKAGSWHLPGTPQRITVWWDNRCESVLEILNAPCKEKVVFYPRDDSEFFLKFVIGCRLEHIT